MSEGLISVIISSLFTDGITPHIPLCFGSSDCDGETIILFENLIAGNTEPEYGDYGFITNLQHYHEYAQKNNIKINEEFIDYIVIQILHTIYILQDKFSMIHLDIYLRNIYIKDFNNGNKNKPYFNGVIFEKKIKYLKYLIPGSDPIYLPFDKFKFIVKVGDFGISTINITTPDNKNIIFYIEYDGLFDRSIIIKNNFPNYPNDYRDNHFPDYFFILRDLLQEFGCISELLIRLNRELPEISDKFYSRYELLKI